MFIIDNTTQLWSFVLNQIDFCLMVAVYLVHYNLHFITIHTSPSAVSSYYVIKFPVAVRFYYAFVISGHLPTYCTFITIAFYFF